MGVRAHALAHLDVYDLYSPQHTCMVVQQLEALAQADKELVAQKAKEGAAAGLNESLSEADGVPDTATHNTDNPAAGATY